MKIAAIDSNADMKRLLKRRKLFMGQFKGFNKSLKRQRVEGSGPNMAKKWKPLGKKQLPQMKPNDVNKQIEFINSIQF